MLKLALCLFLLTAVLGMSPLASRASEEPKLVHNVYFVLKDNSPEAKKKLIASCKKYLAKHDGTIYFSAGTLAEELKREANDRDWDVALHLVFVNKAAHDKYQAHPLHKQFVEENRDNFKKVRVFDSLVD
jgi:hypothetical protein